MCFLYLNCFGILIVNNPKIVNDNQTMYKSIIKDLDKNMQIRIESYTKERIDDVLAFEHELRRQEDSWDWEIDEAYEESVRVSFVDQALMEHLRKVLKEQYNVSVLIGLIASNRDAQNFYRSLPNSLIRDDGIWVDL